MLDVLCLLKNIKVHQYGNNLREILTSLSAHFSPSTDVLVLYLNHYQTPCSYAYIQNLVFLDGVEVTPCVTFFC